MLKQAQSPPCFDQLVVFTDAEPLLRRITGLHQGQCKGQVRRPQIVPEATVHVLVEWPGTGPSFGIDPRVVALSKPHSTA
uniref:Protein-serine/threonine phosphatase n=1 Tax=Panagrellus redivivus TaxID=6233 RepID=A0A7E4UUN2_PANRE